MNKLVLLLALAIPLGGCIKFGAEPPPSLLTLSSAAPVPVGQTQNSGSAETITIGVPAVPQELATNRVPVRSNATEIAYVKDAQWVEQPSRLFARLLADTVSVRTGRVVLSTRQSLVDPGAQLTGELRAFGMEAESSEAVVTFDAALLRTGGKTFEKRSVEARVPVTEITPATVGPALSQAANQVAGEVADWVGR